MRRSRRFLTLAGIVAIGGALTLTASPAKAQHYGSVGGATGYGAPAQGFRNYYNFYGNTGMSDFRGYYSGANGFRNYYNFYGNTGMSDFRNNYNGYSGSFIGANSGLYPGYFSGGTYGTYGGFSPSFYGGYGYTGGYNAGLYGNHNPYAYSYYPY